MRWLGAALVWLSASSGLLLAGFAAFGGLVLLPTLIARGDLPGSLQRDALGAVYFAIAAKALLPELGLSLASWLVLARVAPALERSGRALALALPLVAAAWFPFVARYLFDVWTPNGPRDYAVTLILVAGGAALALLAPRALSAHLAPGSFATPPKRGMVGSDD